LAKEGQFFLRIGNWPRICNCHFSWIEFGSFKPQPRLVFATSGLIKVYREIKAFAEHAKFYDRMQLALQLTLHRLDAAIKDANITLAIELIKELGQEALTENGNWLLMHRERPILVRGIF